MSGAPPSLIAIDHDDYHAAHIGRTPEGDQFFLTTPFVPATKPSEGSEFVALFLFSAAGDFLDAKINEFGPREQMDREARTRLCEQRLRELGQISCGRIEVKPFAIDRFGTTFGLIVREPEDGDDVWAVELQLGNYMAFFEPWDSGLYDT